VTDVAVKPRKAHCEQGTKGLGRPERTVNASGVKHIMAAKPVPRLLTFAFSCGLAASFARSASAEGTARVGCEVRENGAPAAGSFRIARSEQPETAISSGVCGKDLELAPGSYELTVVLDGALGDGEQRFSVSPRAGSPSRVKASFETGELSVEVTRDGRRAAALVQLLRAGVELAKLSAGMVSRVVTGTYALSVESRGESRRVEAVVIARAERRVVSVAFGSSLARSTRALGRASEEDPRVRFDTPPK